MAQLWCTTSALCVSGGRSNSTGVRATSSSGSGQSGSSSLTPASEPDGADGRALQFPASMVLREDLGGEDIVYLAASGESLTMVDRDHHRGDDLDQQVTVSIFPHHLALFDAATGDRVGRGARLQPPTPPVATSLSSPDPVGPPCLKSASSSSPRPSARCTRWMMSRSPSPAGRSPVSSGRPVVARRR